MINNKRALILGGSKGIGKAIAEEFVLKGGSTCIVARGEKALASTKKHLESLKISNTQEIDTIMVDVTDYDKLKMHLLDYIRNIGVPDYLINCVGYANPKYINELTIDEIKKQIDTNIYAQLMPVHIMIPYMIKERKGHIANVSSAMGFMGIIGYTAYCASKYAVLGFSEALRNEVSPYGVKVSVLLPADTKTPGFEEENKIKPPECAMLSEAADLYEPEFIAKVFWKGINKGKFFIVPGSLKWIWRIRRFFPKLVFSIIDKDLKKARKKLGKE